jgi:phage terminase small subunit
LKNQQDDVLPKRCPDDVTDPLAVAHWRHLLGKYQFVMGDRGTLMLLCGAYANAIRAQRQITEDGLTVREAVFSRSGNKVGERLKNHPLLATLKTERAHYAQLCKCLGLYEGAADDAKEETPRAYQFS